MRMFRLTRFKRSLLWSLLILIGIFLATIVNSQDPLKIVPIGNSITHGNTYSFGPNSFRRDLWNMLNSAGYNVDFVGSLDTDRYGDPFPDGSFDHDHEGHWGWRADEIVAGLPGWLTGYTPDVALIHIGSNDAIQANTVESTLDEIEDIIGILRNDNAGITIFLAQILPLENPDRNARIEGINAGLITMASNLDQAQSRIILVDQNSGWVPGTHTYDGVHPNTAGEARMAQRWFNAFDAYYSSNVAPEITGQNSLSMDEDQSLTLEVSDFTIDDPDTDPGDMTLIVSGGSHYSVSGRTITPEANWSGTLSVAVKVSDGVSESNEFDASVAVDAVNDAPVISGQSTLEVNEGSSLELTLSHFSFSDVDDPGGPFFLGINSGSNYSLEGNTITPEAQFQGTLSVPITISDGSDASGLFYAQVSVNEVNDPPVITGQTLLSTNEDNSLTLQVSDFTIDDPDTDPGEMTLIVSGGSHYSVSGSTITPEANWSGTLSVPVKVSDGVSESNEFEVSVTIDTVNDAPIVTVIPNQTIPHGETFDSIRLNEYVSDIETSANDMMWTVSGNVNLEVSIGGQAARITVRDQDWHGQEAVEFIATDDDPADPLSDSYISIFTIEEPVSVADKTAPAVNIYLDRTSGFLNITDSEFKSLSVSILTANGRSLLSQSITGSDQSIDLSHHPDGIYFVVLRADGFEETRKVIK